MTIEADGEAVAEVNTNAAPEAAVLSQEQGTRDFETEARDQGWRPKEEWTGKPGNWKDAKSFVEYDEVRAKVSKEVTARLEKVERVNQRTIEALKRTHDREIAELRASKTEAVKAGDVKAVEAIDAAIDHAKANAPDKEPAGETDDAETKFKAANPWYGSDDELSALAEGFSKAAAAQYFEKNGKPMPYEDNLRQVETKVKASAAYKAKFGADKTAANGHAAVDGGSENGAGPSRASPLAKLTAAERSKAKEDMKAYPKIYPSEQSWVDAYNS